MLWQFLFVGCPGQRSRPGQPRLHGRFRFAPLAVAPNKLTVTDHYPVFFALFASLRFHRIIPARHSTPQPRDGRTMDKNGHKKVSTWTSCPAVATVCQQGVCARLSPWAECQMTRGLTNYKSRQLQKLRRFSETVFPQNGQTDIDGRQNDSAALGF